LRIVGGMAGGLRLCAPRGAQIRPTSDRVKEALFSSLGDIRGWSVVDLFAGTGALGLEALSRGAAAVTLIEKSQKALDLIRQNLDRVTHCLGPDAVADVRILRADVASAPAVAAELAGAIDLVLADPPYRPAARDFGGADLIQDTGIARWAQGALLVLEHAADTRLPWAPASTWRLLRTRRFGSRALSYARADRAD